MLLYSDVITNDELFTDSYKMIEVDDIVYELDCAMVKVKKGADVDIGANPSAEGGEDEEVADDEEIVNNIVAAMRLNSTTFDKKAYMTYIKGYMKAIKKYLEETKPDRVSAFEKGAAGFVKKVLGNFKDYEFYTGDSMNPDGMVALLNYREDGVTPYLIFFKDGVKEVKL